MGKKGNGGKDDDVEACYYGCGSVTRSDIWLVDLLEPD
jgi:hypothetical protein